MNLDEFKKTWQAYDQKLAATNLINEKIIRSMIKERSNSTLARIRRDSILTLVLMIAVSSFCGLSIIYNAFDYRYLLQYVPLTMIGIASGIFSVLLLREYAVAQMNLAKENLAQSLRSVLEQHKKFMSSNRKLGIVIISAGMLWPIGNMPQIIENKGLPTAIGLIVLTFSVQASLIFIARKAGAFKDRHGDRLRDLLKELEEFEQ